MELLRIEESVAASQQAKLAGVKADRDASSVTASLDAVRAAARGADNLMPAILDAVRAYASVGEISAALRGVFGEYQESY